MGTNDEKIWLFGFFLLPVVFAASVIVETRHYIFDIEDHILKGINKTNSTSDELDLSGLALRGLEEGALRNVLHVKLLDLSKNSLSNLPDGIFSRYRDLEHLSLAHNRFVTLNGSIFLGLTNLKSLNISNNRIGFLHGSNLFGLGKITNVFTGGHHIHHLSTRVFENPDLEDSLCKTLTEEEAEEIAQQEEELTKPKDDVDIPVLDKNLRVKVCIREGTVEKLEVLKDLEELESHCIEIAVNHAARVVRLSNLGISNFSNGWYRLRGYPINALQLLDNNIVDVTSEMLNDLPESVQYVDLAHNKIERLVNGRIFNEYLAGLDFVNNAISEIENGAFENTKLSSLVLNRNRLKNTSFAGSLPPTLKTLNLGGNSINELPSGSFATLNNLRFLGFVGNDIAKLNSGCFLGLVSLEEMVLALNHIETIEPGAFRALKSLKRLDLASNSITSLDKGVFDGLENIEVILFFNNRLKKITRESFDSLPDTLKELHLEFNRIESLENGTFVSVPKMELDLGGNKIKKIEAGTFNLPTLEKLTLANNLLSQPDGASFAGLGKLRYLDLTNNRISKIEKGIVKNMRELVSLDLSYNPIRRLENGALFGFPKSSCSGLKFYRTPIELIQAGVFDERR